MIGILLSVVSAVTVPTFTDVTKEAGISFHHSVGDSKMDNIVEGTGAGVCTFDYNNDGLLDLYFVTGTWTKGVSDNRSRSLQGKLSNALYRNKGDGTFLDVTKAAGVEGKGIYSTGCTAADIDNDGDVDLYVLNYGKNLLYKNNGDGSFTDVSAAAGLDNPRWSVHASWLDYDRDGCLDVYVANYLLYDDGKFRDFYPVAGYPGPLSYNGEADAFYRNNCDGTFKEVTKEVGMFKPEGRAMSVTSADFNNDGWPDVYVANDAMENYYFENTGKGTFVEKGIEKGIAFSEHGQGVSSMGPVFGDFDRNGLLDLFIPDLRYNSLLLQKGKMFVDQTRQAGLSETLGQYSGWAGMAIDVDHDGWLDLYTVHGHAHHEFVQEDTLLRNKGDGTFEDVSKLSGACFKEKHVGRGGTYLDYDNDGDMDFAIVDLGEAPRLLRNDGASARPWLTVDARLKFPTGGRTAVGSRVTVTSGTLTRIDDVQPGRGYLSQGDPRLHFGLSGEKEATVEIRWPDGTTEKREKVPANQILTLEHEMKAGKKK